MPGPNPPFEDDGRLGFPPISSGASDAGPRSKRPSLPAQARLQCPPVARHGEPGAVDARNSRERDRLRRPGPHRTGGPHEQVH